MKESLGNVIAGITRNISFRLVEVSDAETILKLRIDPLRNCRLTPIPNAPVIRFHRLSGAVRIDKDAMNCRFVRFSDSAQNHMTPCKNAECFCIDWNCNPYGSEKCPEMKDERKKRQR